MASDTDSVLSFRSADYAPEWYKDLVKACYESKDDPKNETTQVEEVENELKVFPDEENPKIGKDDPKTEFSDKEKPNLEAPKVDMKDAKDDKPDVVRSAQPDGNFVRQASARFSKTVKAIIPLAVPSASDKVAPIDVDEDYVKPRKESKGGDTCKWVTLCAILFLVVAGAVVFTVVKPYFEGEDGMNMAPSVGQAYALKGTNGVPSSNPPSSNSASDLDELHRCFGSQQSCRKNEACVYIGKISGHRCEPCGSNPVKLCGTMYGVTQECCSECYWVRNSRRVGYNCSNWAE